jgi:SAM-dependent MidA family methyltransferase
MLRDLIVERIRARGPITVAEYMELALYHPEHGYYARASRRSGRAGDFFTSVDVGPLFGQMLARQFVEMWLILDRGAFDLVEAGAGDGRLASDILDAAVRYHADFYEAIRLHLVERSPAARARHHAVLGVHASRPAASAATLPEKVSGVIYANELLDALPVHVVRMTQDGLREIWIDLDGDRLHEIDRAPSTPDLSEYLERVGTALLPGARAEISLSALTWITTAARALDRGFLVIIDYGHEAEELYSGSHATGTLAGFRAHRASAELSEWLDAPGEHDLTAHVDLTSVRRAAEDAGLETIGVLDQTYFLLGLGIADTLAEANESRVNLKQRLAAKTLLLPGGLGSTHKVMIFGRGVGRPALRGCSYRVRVT